MFALRLFVTVFTSLFIAQPPITAGQELFLQCPFNELCMCGGGGERGPVFTDVKCERSLEMPVFKGVHNEYRVTGTFYIASDVNEIPANAFEAFKSINVLSLELGGDNSGSAGGPDWDPSAFADVQINSLITSDVDGLIPPPEAFRELGRNGGLQTMEIKWSTVNESVPAGAWEDFVNLTSLTIFGTNVASFDDAAFQGLEDTLTRLELSMTSLSTIPYTALSRLTSLQILDMNGNRIINITESIESLPESLRELRLSYSGLEYVDPKMDDVVGRPAFQKLNLASDINLMCDTGMRWMAKYAFCDPKRLNIRKAYCRNQGTSLEKYLKLIAPNPCKKAHQ